MNHKKIKKGRGSLPLLSAAILFLLAGAAVFLYPVISNLAAEHNQARVVQSYDQTLEETDSEELQKQWALAEEYNENLNGDPVHDPFVPGSGYVLPKNYEEVLNIGGVMCYLEIPKIDLRLPVYHGTSEEVLEKGVGHLESTALPVGGKSRHCVLTGHRGLPSAELFTRLDEMETGDYFYIRVLGKTLTYRVDQIEVIEPEELDKLVPEAGKDLVTLLTCTPYGVNTHRLLVRGEQCEYVPPETAKGEGGAHLLKQLSRWQPYQICTAVIVLTVILLVLLFWKLGNRRKKKVRRREDE